MGKNSSPEIQDAIIRAYEGGLTQEEAAARFGYSGRVCYDALRRAGKKARTTSEARKQYHVDDHFFDVIDTEEKAYFLGLLGSDGCITDGRVKLTLEMGDKQHLQKFLTCLRSDYPIHTERKKKKSGEIAEYANISICSSIMIKALKKLGIVERKSLIYTPPDTLPDHLWRHYWRGLTDGDGSIFFTKNSRGNKESISLAMSGSYNAMKGFSEFASQHTNSNATVRPVGNIFVIEYKGMRAPQKLLAILYGNSSIYLDRKKKLADKALAMTVVTKDYSGIERKETELLYKEFGNWRIVGEKLGLPEYAIYCVKQRLGL